ncbi:MAG TPA: bifunctional UDP-N-acetylglucosamine diphosphorylase/glucosamine-1-phosphate N-acetyltransferase GlmU [Acetivibrio sp.]|nr:bifunctional UDP-N-acetylglucosamine diphosphorylase/glucosamine-1-phosphate N-acetyltransferase GlmU [Acetivibrio sp.]
MEQMMAVILAAGEGKRMKSKKAKVLHEICGMPLVKWVYQSARNAGINDTVIVVGHKAQEVKEKLGDEILYAFQEKQLGTGHAVMQAQEHFADKEGYVIVLYGDTPLITAETLKDAISFHKENNNSATVITADLDDPTGYGRIIRSGDGSVLRIVEHKDASDEEKNIKEVNSGMYCFNISDLREALGELDNNNSQGEYYLTDTIEILLNKGKNVKAFKIKDSNEILGINDRIQLAKAGEIIRNRILQRFMENGVTIIDPASTFIDQEAEIGIDTVIYPSTIIEGTTKIGEDCVIGPGSRIVSCEIADGVEVKNSVLLESSIDSGTKVGPFAYMRPGSKIGKNVKIGDFVEVKKSIIGDKTKISHLTYVGDAEIGKGVNLGCGVVVVNYDGKKKNKTVVGDNCFVGCNVNLISPVEVEDNAYIAAGSTITDLVPENALAIARSRQVIKENWVVKKGMLKEDKKD